MKLLGLVLGLALCAAVSISRADAAVAESDFRLQTTGDLVDLCAANQNDPMYTAAVNFCHGFSVGVVRVLQEEDAAERARHLFCLPNPPPTRSEAIADFEQWANADSSRLSLPPADGLASYLSQRYRCQSRR